MIILDYCTSIFKIFIFRPEICSESWNFGFTAQNRDLSRHFALKNKNFENCYTTIQDLNALTLCKGMTPIEIS